MKTTKEDLDKRAKKMFSSIGIFFVGFLLYWIFSKPENLDRRTGCPKRIKRDTVIILDRSSEVAQQTSKEMQERIKLILDEKVHTGERITFYEVNDLAYHELAPIKLGDNLEFCKPKSEAGNILTENDDLIRSRYKKKIDDLLSNKRITSLGRESKSPITQVIFDVSLSKHFLVDNKDKFNSLYVFSDLMENSKDLILYGCSNGKQAIEEYGTNRSGRELRPKFRNISNFELHLVPTQQSMDVVKCRDLFWNWFFGDFEFEDSTKLRKVIPLPG